VRSITCISVLAVWPVVAGAEEARCLVLDTSSPWLERGAEERSLRSLSVTVLPVGAELATLNVTAIFAGPSVEAPDAVADGIYGQTFACVPGPEDSWAEDLPVWVQNGGWLCANPAGTIQLQLVEMDRETVLWTTGTELDAPFGDYGSTAWTTRGNFSVGYALVPAGDPGICGL
jgi:hypothetical protein